MKAKWFLSGMCIMMMLVASAQDSAEGTVFYNDGTIEFSEETFRLLADASYREQTYPDTYRIEQVPDLLEQGKILFALWTLINVYPDNPKQSGTVMRMLAQKGVHGQLLLNAFYTYVFADPRIFHFGQSKGSSYMQDPKLLEYKLENCKRLIAYTEDYLKAIASGE